MFAIFHFEKQRSPQIGVVIKRIERIFCSTKKLITRGLRVKSLAILFLCKIKICLKYHIFGMYCIFVYYIFAVYIEKAVTN